MSDSTSGTEGPAWPERFFLGWLGDVGEVFLLLGQVIRGIPAALGRPGLIVTQMAHIGVGSMPLTVIVALFTGAVAAVQAAYQMRDYVPMLYLGTLVGKSVVIELGPVLTALVVGGRVGASIAAELGTMRVTEQVDALETLAYNPFAYLVVPRVAAGVLMFPVIIAFSMGVGLVTGWAAATSLLPISSPEFVRGVRLFYVPFDWQYGLIKAASFGFMITLIGCFLGLSARNGAEGVGSATTRTVVYSAAMILVLDAYWAVTLLRH